MPNQPETPSYDAGVYQLQSTDPVQGNTGSNGGGISNAPLLNLANRTAYLKQHMDNIENGSTLPGAAAPIASPNFTGTPTAPTPAAGDNSAKIATTAFVDTAIFGVATVNVAGGSNVTLTPAQYGCGIIILTGVITANFNLIFPTGGKWIVENTTTGAFNITCKTAGGTGVVVPQGFSVTLYSDGTNIIQIEVGPTTGTGSYVLSSGAALTGASLLGQTTISSAVTGTFSQPSAVSGTWYTAIPYSSLNTIEGTWIIRVDSQNVKSAVYIMTIPTTAFGVPFLTQLQAGTYASAQLDGSNNLQISQNFGSSASVSATWFKMA